VLVPIILMAISVLLSFFVRIKDQSALQTEAESDIAITE